MPGEDLIAHRRSSTISSGASNRADNPKRGTLDGGRDREEGEIHIQQQSNRRFLSSILCGVPETMRAGTAMCIAALLTF
jgi:hypothetical protein